MIPNDETGYSFVRPFSRFSSANFSRDPSTGGRNFIYRYLEGNVTKRQGMTITVPSSHLTSCRGL